MCDELVKKVIAINLNKQNPDKKTEDVDKNKLDTSEFTEILEVSRLTEIKFNARMAEATKTL